MGVSMFFISTILAQLVYLLGGSEFHEVVSDAPFQRPDLYKDEFENKSIQGKEYNTQSRFTSQHDETSHYGGGAADGIFPGLVG